MFLEWECVHFVVTRNPSNIVLQVEARHENSIYEETRPEVWLDLYGDEMPTKIEAWTVGPAHLRLQFDNSIPTPQPPELDSLALPEFTFDFLEHDDDVAAEEKSEQN